KNILVDKHIDVFYIDAEDIASRNHIKGKISKIMEVLILNLLHVEDAVSIVCESVQKAFATKGQNVVDSNINAVHEALDSVKKLKISRVETPVIEVVDDSIVQLINERKGATIPVSRLVPYAYGKFESGTAAKEKRGISNIVPNWIKENCISCGMCSFVCPHAVIRSVTSEDESKGIPFIGQDGLRYVIEISEADCTGCGLCVNICPGKGGNKALEMIAKPGIKNAMALVGSVKNPLNKFTVKGSQLEKPLFEFSGACAGCGETPYLKLLTQLFGHSLVIANATGCSSIYGGSVPSTPYLIPWSNSLFEDNAEFAVGIHLSYEQKRDRIEHIMKESLESVDENVKQLFLNWLENKNDYMITSRVKEELETSVIPKELNDLLDYVPARTVWAVGGDGWAYDIGYGGLDHVLHLNQNLKVLVLDTEVYSNTGGQASKSTKLGAVAEFANFGKKTVKKDLFKIASSVPNCYVASISLGANFNQAIKVFKEASEHDGPAIIIAYSPCVEQGIKTGMGTSILEEKLAVECGYTLLLRYDGKKYYLDSKEPDFSKYEEFLDNEVRFNALKIKDKELASRLLEEQKEYARKRYAYYRSIVDGQENES
ncbi:MAG: 4Fe-4S dicluster domain-containing protein, partial [Bacilli bacterium]|nr:4Fe-4S dicluster domain-containing protein [Bacilli bacterium]